MAAKHYQKSEEKLWKEARESYQNLSEKKKQKAKTCTWNVSKFFWRKKKEKKCQYYRDRYKNLSEDQEQRLTEYRMKLLLEWNYYITNKVMNKYII